MGYHVSFNVDVLRVESREDRYKAYRIALGAGVAWMTPDEVRAAEGHGAYGSGCRGRLDDRRGRRIRTMSRPATKKRDEDDDNDDADSDEDDDED